MKTPEKQWPWPSLNCDAPVHTNFDLIIAMDEKNRANLNTLCPEGVGKVRLLTEFAQENLGYDYIPDPYYTRDFNQALDIIDQSLSGLIENLNSANTA